MAAKLRLSPRANKDTQEVFNWYELKGAHLGERFLSATERCLNDICDHPLIYKSVHKDFRRALLKRFPYAVFFKFQNDVVDVYCVCHTSREPQRWRKLLK